jgi:type II secretory pathway component PulK
MKPLMPHCSQSHRLRYASNKSGMALVLVLSAVVLLSVLILAFMSSVGVERVASGSQLNQTEARVLSENVLSLVTAQIRDASTGTTAWISQPGAIRTFTGSQQPDRVYQL